MSVPPLSQLMESATKLTCPHGDTRWESVEDNICIQMWADIKRFQHNSHFSAALPPLGAAEILREQWKHAPLSSGVLARALVATVTLPLFVYGKCLVHQIAKVYIVSINQH